MLNETEIQFALSSHMLQGFGNADDKLDKEYFIIMEQPILCSRSVCNITFHLQWLCLKQRKDTDKKE